MAVPPPPKPLPPPPPPPKKTEPAPVKNDDEEDSGSMSLAEVRAKLMGKKPTSAAAPGPPKGLPPPNPPVPKTLPPPTPPAPSKPLPPPAPPGSPSKTLPPPTPPVTSSPKLKEMANSPAAVSKAKETGPPTGTFEKPVLRSTAPAATKAPVKEVAPVSTTAAVKTTVEPVKEVTKSGAAPAGTVTSTSVAGGSGGAQQQETVKLLKEVLEESSRQKMHDDCMTQRAQLLNDQNEQFMMLFFAYQSQKSILHEKSSLRNMKQELHQFHQLEADSRQILAQEESTSRTTLLLPFLCTSQMQIAAIEQRQFVLKTLQEHSANSQKEFQQRALKEQEAQNDADQKRAEVMNSRLQGIEIALNTAFNQAADKADPKDGFFYKARRLMREEITQRDFVEDLQLSIRRDLVSMCCGVLLSPFRQLRSSVDSYGSPDSGVASQTQRTFRQSSSPPRALFSDPANLKKSPSPVTTNNTSVSLDPNSHILKIYFIEIGYKSSAAESLALLFSSHHFFLVDAAEGDKQLNNDWLLLRQVSEALRHVTSEDLMQMGMDSVGERRLLLSRIQQFEKSFHLSVGHSEQLAGSSRSSSVSEVKHSGERPMLNGGDSPKPFGPKESIGIPEKAAQLQVYFTLTRQRLRAQDGYVQKEWDALRQNALLRKERDSDKNGVGLSESRDAMWEAQWRRACIMDLQAEAEWEKKMSKLMERLQCGLNVEGDEIPPEPFGKMKESAETSDRTPSELAVGSQRSARHSLLLHRSAGLRCPKKLSR